MLCEEADGLLSSLDAYEHFIDGSALPYEVGLSGLRGLVLALVLIVLNDLAELLEVN